MGHGGKNRRGRRRKEKANTSGGPEAGGPRQAARGRRPDGARTGQVVASRCRGDAPRPHLRHVNAVGDGSEALRLQLAVGSLAEDEQKLAEGDLAVVVLVHLLDHGLERHVRLAAERRQE